MNSNDQSLTQWLEEATAGLSAEAKERIKLEIESHFQEAVDAHRSDGQTEAQAQTTALEDLGDAEVWAKCFRKTHLTKDEAERLEKIWTSHKKWIERSWGMNYAAIVGMSAFVCAMCMILMRQTSSFVPPVLAAATMLWSIVGLFLRKGHPGSWLPKSVVLDILTTISFAVFFVFYGPKASAMAFLCAMFVVPGGTVRKIALWLKIRKMNDFWREMPPPDATAS
jgi:hypothetical protein